MHTKSYTIRAVLLVGYVLGTTPSTLAATEASREYRIKAAFLYNFISFVEWPGEKATDEEQPIVITILGETPFGNAFEKHKEKQIKNRQIRLLNVPGFSSRLAPKDFDDPVIKQKLVQLKNSHVLFICESEKKNLQRVVEHLEDMPILLVADTPNALQSGVCINFVIVKNKLGFEIDMTAAEKAQLKLRARLLKIAKRVIK